MQLRFTLSNSIAGSHNISNPEGWSDIRLKLERSLKENFHSIVEAIDVPLTFFGSNGVDDGGYDYIKSVEVSQGVNATIGIFIEISEDEGNSWEEFFTGNIDLSDLEEYSDGEKFFKLKAPIIQTDLWSKFINRFDTPVNIRSLIDLDGNVCSPADSIDLLMASQTIRQIYDGDLNDGRSFFIGDLEEGGAIQMDFDLENLSEIKEKHTIPITNTTLPSDVAPLFTIERAGEYEFDLRIELSLAFGDCTFPSCSSCPIAFDNVNGTAFYDIDLFIKVSNESAVQLSEVNNSNESTTYTYQATRNLLVGDEIFIYAVLNNIITDNPLDHNLVVWGINNTIQDYQKGNFTPVDGECAWISNTPTEVNLGTCPSGAQIPTYLNLIANTVYEDTEADAFLIHDVGDAIVRRITGLANSFYSENLGGIIHGYAENGCNFEYSLLKGLHVRGYSIEDKPYFQSMKEFWEGVAPIFSLGLGYTTLETSPGTEVIEIAPLKEFYDESDYSHAFEFVDQITRSYDKEHIFKKINVGYQKWSAESDGGIDDPQTRKTYATVFSKIGTEISFLSRFIAAGLAIEQTRRNRAEQSKDWRLDEDTMIIALNVAATPDYQPEFDEFFSSITGINNGSTRYNLRLTPAWNFLRWISYVRGCLQKYTDSEFTYQSSEGNADFSATMDADSDCILFNDTNVGENEDIEVGIGFAENDFIHLPDLFEFESKLSWRNYKAIRNNRKLSILVSKTDSDHEICHIKTLDYNPFDAKCKTSAWVGGRTDAVPGYLLSIEMDNSNPSQEYDFSFAQGADVFSGELTTVPSPDVVSDSDVQRCVLSTITATVNKTSNGGLAKGAGSIVFKKNGVTVNTISFVQNEDISTENYVYTGLVCGDELSVLITETKPIVTLTVDYSGGTWDIDLSQSIGQNITLTGGIASGSPSAGCAVVVETDTGLLNLTINSGNSGGTQTTDGLTCVSNYYRITDSITINGSAKSHGQTLELSTVILNIVIQHRTCTLYPC